MVKKKIICDRCGKECEDFRYSRGHHIFRNKFYMRKSNYDEDIIDLCQKCYDSLAKWMKAESEEKNGKRVQM